MSKKKKVSSFADYLTDWERLLTAVNNHETELPDLTAQVGPMETLLQEGKTVSVRQFASLAQFRGDAKRRRELVNEGRAAASRLRAALRAHFGTHNERLAEFGASPLRPRRAIPPDPDPEPPIPPGTE
jgi:hypothetical protein